MREFRLSAYGVRLWRSDGYFDAGHVHLRPEPPPDFGVRCRFEEQLQGFLEVGTRLLDRASLTGNIHLRTQGDEAITVAFDDRSQLGACDAGRNRLHGRIIFGSGRVSKSCLWRGLGGGDDHPEGGLTHGGIHGHIHAMKTAISLPDSLFRQADQMAAELSISRSRLVAMALEEFIRRHRQQRVTERLDAVYRDLPERTVSTASWENLRKLTADDTW